MAQKRLNAFDEARQMYQRLVSGVGTVGKQVRPNYSLGNRLMVGLGNSPVGKAIVGLQKGIETRTLPRVNLQQYTAGIKAPVPRVAAQMGTGIAEEFVNLPQRLLEGGGRVGLNVRAIQQGKKVTPQRWIGSAAAVADPLLDIAFLGGGTAAKSIGKQALKQGGKATLKQAIKKGVVKGAVYGAGYGGLKGLAAGDEATLQNFAMGAGGGALFGGALGGASAGVGGLMAMTRRTSQVEKQLRDKAGKWIAGEVPVKPKGMPEAQWKFQLEFNAKYQRNPYTPVYPTDLKAAVKYEAGKKSPGLSIRDVSKDTNPLGTPLVESPNALQGDIGVNGGKSPLPLSQATTEQTLPLSKTGGQIPGDGGQANIPGNGSLPDSIDPIQKIINALKEAKPIRGEQEALYSAERARRAARVAGVGERVSGEQGYFAQLGQLKGELPKAQFEGIRKQLQQPDIDSLFDKVEKSAVFSPFEKVTAKTGLAKLLGAEGGTVPTEGELKLLSEVFPPEFIQSVLQKRPLMQKLWGGFEEALNLPRSIMATLDLSAPLRQGVFLIGRPKQFLPAFKDMFKYALNEKAYNGLADQIKARPTYKLMRQSKLALTDTGPILKGREEAFMSNLAERIPGFGRLAKSSNRAYSGFLNKLRADTFDDMLKHAEQLGITKERPQIADDIAKFVNTATGRGGLGALNRASVVLNGAFFSPRLMASRLNLLNPVYYAKLDPFVRKEALKSLFSFAGTAMGVMTLAKLGGAEVSTDPRSADFAKIKVGNTRYDVLGGFQQYIRLAGQLITGQKINTQTGKLTTLGEGYAAPTRLDVLQSFFESKTSPVASFALAMLKGQNAVGEKVNIPTEVINRFLPMISQDMYDISKEKGSPLGAIPALFGVGVQTYGSTEMVSGENQIGESTSQIRQVQGLGESITEKVFGRQPLGSSTSSNVETYYDQLMKMPVEQRTAQISEIAKTNPDLLKKVITVAKERKLGMTVEDKYLKEKGVASGDRAVEIVKNLKKFKAPQEKNAYITRLIKLGILNKDVIEQLKLMKKEGEL